MKLSPLAHQADAHEDAVWSAAWTVDEHGRDRLITGSVDETVKGWNVAEGGLENTRAYEGTPHRHLLRGPFPPARRDRLRRASRSPPPRPRPKTKNRRSPRTSARCARARTAACSPPPLPAPDPPRAGLTLGVVSLDAAPNGLVAVSCLDNMVKVFDDREQKATANIHRERRRELGGGVRARRRSRQARRRRGLVRRRRPVQHLQGRRERR